MAIAPDARERINAARAYVDRKLADKAVVYGLTTGFGKFSTVFVPEEKIVYDMEYIERQSVLLDVQCLLKTAALVFTHRGAR